MPRTKNARKRKDQTVGKPAVQIKKEKKEDSSTSQDSTSEKVVSFSGSVPVDEGFPQYVNGPYHVYSDALSTYNAMLNQTNIGQNNNKYYIIQIVKHNKEDKFINLCRWGRVGKVAGKTAVENGLLSAIADFEKKFRAKTGNRWGQGWQFTKQAGKYDLVKIDYGEEEAKDELQKSTEVIPSKLDERVRDVMSTIFDKKLWEATVKEMKFDVNKAPLGKLTKAQIKAGYESLKNIEECLKPGTSEAKLTEACNEFYTRIPHDFGMKRPPLIRTTDDIKEKMQLIEALDDIQIGVSLMQSDVKSQLNELDQYYESLQCDISPLEKKDQEYKTIAKYVKNTHGALHNYFKLDIEDIFKVYKEKNAKKFKKDIGNRMLLWHGSRLTNWCGILKEGLRIAPPEAPVTGYMFGKGVYFADVVSKSAGYCCTSIRQPIGFLLICDVALGNMNKKKNGDFNASKLPKGKHSTKGLGRQEPCAKQNLKLEDGAVVPLGKPKDVNDDSVWLRYNEFIVYDTAQINPRYLVKLRFKY